MKVKIKVGHSVKVQAAQFEPVEESDGLELDVEVADEAELTKVIEKWQSYIRERVINSAFEGARVLVAKRAKMFLSADSKE